MSYAYILRFTCDLCGATGEFAGAVWHLSTVATAGSSGDGARVYAGPRSPVPGHRTVPDLDTTDPAEALRVVVEHVARAGGWTP